jgi:hypothetical protein
VGYSIGSKIRFVAADGLEYTATIVDYNYNNAPYYLVQPDGYSQVWILESAITGWA